MARRSQGRFETMMAPRQPLNVRRGVGVGLIVLAVLAPGIAMRSETPFLTLVETLMMGIAAVFGAVAVVEAVNRWQGRPRSRGPALHTRQAAALGLGVGLLTEAAVSVRTADPLATFVSNVAFVLWVALLVLAAALFVERRVGQAGA